MLAHKLGLYAIDGLALGAATLLAAPFFFVLAVPFLPGL